MVSPANICQSLNEILLESLSFAAMPSRAFSSRHFANSNASSMCHRVAEARRACRSEPVVRVGYFLGPTRPLALSNFSHNLVRLGQVHLRVHLSSLQVSVPQYNLGHDRAELPPDPRRCAVTKLVGVPNLCGSPSRALLPREVLANSEGCLATARDRATITSYRIM